MPGNPATPVRVYLSTVPRDAVPEREILARVVFPELERRAAALGIAIVLVEPEEDWDLARRFAEIGTCQLLVGLLGEPYGNPPPWIPDDLRARHEWLSDAGRSTAEIEIRYALEAPEMRCFFYVRDPDGLPEDTERLTGLKELVRASGWSVDGYSRSPGLEPFASRVLESLWAALRAGTLEAVPAEPPKPEVARGATEPDKPLPLHEDVRFTRAITKAVNAEIDALATWLGVDVDR